MTVTLNGPPAVAEVGAETFRWVPPLRGCTATVAEPVIEAVAVSVAVTVWLPAVFRVTPLKVCTPSPAVEGVVGRQHRLDVACW